MEDPYADPPPKCILCKYDVELDYKVYATIAILCKLTVITTTAGIMTMLMVLSAVLSRVGK